MAGRGERGGAEALARLKQFDYKAVRGRGGLSRPRHCIIPCTGARSSPQRACVQCTAVTCGCTVHGGQPGPAAAGRIALGALTPPFRACGLALASTKPSLMNSTAPPRLHRCLCTAAAAAPLCCCPLPPLPLQNSNLVLTAEQRTSAGREPDGSAETLWGRMKGKMGDRVARERPEGLAERKPRKREAGEGEAFDLPKRRKVGGGGGGRRAASLRCWTAAGGCLLRPGGRRRCR